MVRESIAIGMGSLEKTQLPAAWSIEEISIAQDLLSGLAIAGDFLSPSLISRLIAIRSFDPSLSIRLIAIHSFDFIQSLDLDLQERVVP